MNGREVLACWEAVEPEMTIEPLRNLPVIRDLVVDRTPYEHKVASLRAVARRATEPYPGFPEPLSHKADQARLEGARLHQLHVLLLGLSGDPARRRSPISPGRRRWCSSGRPRSIRGNDQRKVARALARSGIFNCVSCYKCEEVCPAHIPIVSRRHRAAEGEGRATGAADGAAFACVPRRRGARAGASIRAI